jgi:hypothetical protein
MPLINQKLHYAFVDTHEKSSGLQYFPVVISKRAPCYRSRQ